MTTISTAAWVAHDLGLAAGIGGALFGRVGLQPAVRLLADKHERTTIVTSAWTKFSRYQMAGLGLMGLTWLAGRTLLSGRELGMYPRALVIAKDALVLGTIGTAIGASLAGRKLAQRERDGGGLFDSLATPEEVSSEQRLRKVSSTLGIANLVLGAGVLAVTTILAQQAGKSSVQLCARQLPAA